MLTMDQRDEFDRTGLLRLSGVIPAADAHAMADRIWSFLSRQSGVDRHDPATWSTTQPTGFQPVSRAGELDGVRSDLLRAAVDDLIGTSDVHWERPRVLMTFPDRGDSLDRPVRWLALRLHPAAGGAGVACPAGVCRPH